MGNEGPALSKHTLWGFAAQSDYNIPKTTGIVWMPYQGEFSFGPAGRNEPFDMSDTTDGLHEVIPTGDFYSGDIPFMLRADATSLDALVAWLDTVDNYNQRPWCTVYWIERVGGVDRVEAAQDCKIATATIGATAGAPASCVLRVHGRKEYAAHGVTVPDIGSGWGTSYIWSNASVLSNWNGVGFAADVNFHSFEVVYDTLLDEPPDGHRLAGSLNPTRLWNSGGERVSLNVSRDLVSLDFFQAYLGHLRNGIDTAPYPLGLKLSLAGTATLTLTMPRIGIAAHERRVTGGTEMRRTEEPALLALQSRDGLTRACAFGS